MSEHFRREPGTIDIIGRVFGIALVAIGEGFALALFVSTARDFMADKWVLWPLGVGILTLGYIIWYLYHDAQDLDSVVKDRRNAAADREQADAERIRWEARNRKWKAVDQSYSARARRWEFQEMQRRPTEQPPQSPPPRVFIKDYRDHQLNKELQEQLQNNLGLQWLWTILNHAYDTGDWREEALVKSGKVPEEWYRWALHGDNGVLCRLGLVQERGRGGANNGMGRLAIDNKEKALTTLFERFSGQNMSTIDDDYRSSFGESPTERDRTQEEQHDNNASE